MKLFGRKKPKMNPLYRSTELANESVRAAFYEMARYFKLEGDLGREWCSIFTAYNGPERYYHNMNHIYEMLLFLEKHARNKIPERTFYLLVLCAIYHDYYYKVEKPEVKSALAAVIFFLGCAEENSEGDAKFIYACIKATEDHISDDEYIQWLIDADLYRLREPAEVWTPAIRMEYAEYPDEKFNAGRKAVLEHFAARKPFFYHLGEEENQVVYDSLAKQIAEM